MKRVLTFLLAASLGMCTLASCPVVDRGLTPPAAETESSEGGSAVTAVDTPAGATEPQGRAAPSSDDADPTCTEPPDAQEWRPELLRLVNEQRVARGLAAVGRSALLERLAADHACAMIVYDFCGHDNPVTGQSGDDRQVDWMQQYGYRAMGEIVARGQQTPAEMVDMWMNSPTHRKVILNAAYTEAGAGVQMGGAYGLHAVMEFGRPRDLPAEGG